MKFIQLQTKLVFTKNWTIAFIFLMTISFVNQVHAQSYDNDSELDGMVSSMEVGSTNPAGTIIAMGGGGKPIGYIFCDGKLLEKSEYPELFAVIAYTYGGSGSTFKVPDLRGRFLRGWSASSTANLDPDKDDRSGNVGGNTIGSTQGDEFKSHNHSINSGGVHTHRIYAAGLDDRNFSGNTGQKFGTVADAYHLGSQYATSSSTGAHDHSMQNSGGDETRPVNTYVAYWIKATNDEKSLNVSITENMTVNGEVTMGSTLEVTGATTLSDALEVTGATTFSNQVTMNSDMTITGKAVVDVMEVKDMTVNPSLEFPDYVFEKEYVLKPLSEVEEYIDENQHLPDVPSAEHISENGYDVAEMDAVLLRKIEELTLYMISLKKENEQLKTNLNQK